jgi:thiol-disulfide isomerase/thioredoxin
MFGKFFIAISLLSTTLFAYSVGDKIDEASIKKLQLTNDKIYIVDFFASWCSSCKIELPIISQLSTTLDKSKYKIIGVNSDQKESLGKAFVDKLQLKFDVIYDTNNEIISKFAPIGVPAIYYIKNYKIEKVVFGAVHNIDKKIMTDLEKIEN